MTDQHAPRLRHVLRILAPYCALAGCAAAAFAGVDHDANWLAIAGAVGMLIVVLYLLVKTKSEPVGLKRGYLTGTATGAGVVHVVGVGDGGADIGCGDGGC